jgi:hypothetical protein
MMRAEVIAGLAQVAALLSVALLIAVPYARAASAGETRRAETPQSGSVEDEHATRAAGDAQHG